MTIDDLVKEAAEAGWLINPSTLPREGIRDESGLLVGFYCPHLAGHGRMRMGPIYVTPAARGRGLARQAYAADQPLVAYVHAGNLASRRLHEKCGFSLWYRTRHGSYWRRG